MAWSRAKKRAYQNAWKKRKRRSPSGGDVRDGERRYRARKAGAVVGYIPTGWEHGELVRQAYHCAWCGTDIGRELVRVNGHERVDFEADHIVPLAEGGSHTMANMLLACMGCNARRGGQHNGGGRKPASTDDTVL